MSTEAKNPHPKRRALGYLARRGSNLRNLRALKFSLPTQLFLQPSLCLLFFSFASADPSVNGNYPWGILWRPGSQCANDDCVGLASPRSPLGLSPSICKMRSSDWAGFKDTLQANLLICVTQTGSDLSPAPLGSVTLAKALYLSQPPQFPHLQNGDHAGSCLGGL